MIQNKEKFVLKIFLGICIVALVGIGSLLVTAIKQESTVGLAVAVSPPAEQNQQATISEQDAIDIASQLGLGNFEEVELGTQDGALVYEVEFSDGNTESEVIVDAQTGLVIEVETEEEDDKNDEDEYVSSGELAALTSHISEAQAKEIALDAVGSGTVTEVEVEREGGRIVYEVEVEDGRDEFEVVIDYETGEVIEIEED